MDACGKSVDVEIKFRPSPQGGADLFIRCRHAFWESKLGAHSRKARADATTRKTKVGFSMRRGRLAEFFSLTYPSKASIEFVQHVR